MSALQVGLSCLANTAKGALSDNIVASIQSIANSIMVHQDGLDSTVKYACAQRKGPAVTRLLQDADIRARAETLMGYTPYQNHFGHAEEMIRVLSPIVYEQDRWALLDKLRHHFAFSVLTDDRQHIYVSWHPKVYLEKRQDLDRQLKGEYQPSESGPNLTFSQHEFLLLDVQTSGSFVVSKLRPSSFSLRPETKVEKDALEGISYDGAADLFNAPWFLEHYMSAMLHFGFVPNDKRSNVGGFRDEWLRVVAERPTPDWLDLKFSQTNRPYAYGWCSYSEYLTEGTDGPAVNWKYRHQGPENSNTSITIIGSGDLILDVLFGENSCRLVDTPEALQSGDKEQRLLYLTPQTWAMLKDGLQEARNTYITEMEYRKRQRDED